MGMADCVHASRFKDCARCLDKLRAFSEFGTSLEVKLAECDPEQRLAHCLDKLRGDCRPVLDSILHTDFVFPMPPRHVGPATSLLLQHLPKRIKVLATSSSYAERVIQAPYSREYIWGRDVGGTVVLPYPNDAEKWSSYGFLTSGPSRGTPPQGCQKEPAFGGPGWRRL
ncbi:hypothetical protein SELMODRAFT_414756 [Selaginella moellendorffii]|uniref:Uncharacterized protein n=1 Tax=Selaginella moellendorffii TaxID=88036 RepID=D8RTU9_SELML|nr:hypothetical protein SELMODRAFT_414756 [Selaginella moellendorffii]